MSTTVANLLSRARAHDPRFTLERHPNRVLVERLSTLQQQIVKLLARALKDRLSEARNVADTISGALVGVDANGSAYTIATSGDGYDVQVDATTGALYLGDTVIALDPYSDGFPLPADAAELIDVYAILGDTGAYAPVDVRGQRDLPRGGGVALAAIINGWRLIPLINPPASDLSGSGLSPADQTLWTSVASVTVVYVDTPARLTLTGDWGAQALVLPDLYCTALEYDLAAFMARLEAGRDPNAAGLAAQLAAEADRAIGIAQEFAKTDHRPVKFLHTRRNR